jgi:hypothetical protein
MGISKGKTPKKQEGPVMKVLGSGCYRLLTIIQELYEP